MILSNVRRSCQITQQDLALKLGIGRSTISMWETGKCKPDICMVKKLSEALNVSVEEIVNCFK